MKKETAIPSYEVEFIPAERRLLQRRSPIAQMNRYAMESDRRQSPGRRNEDVLAAQAAGWQLPA